MSLQKTISGSPAEKAGVKSGDTITVSVMTQGQAPRDVKVTLVKDPQKDAPILGVEILPNHPMMSYGGHSGPGPMGPDGSL